MESIEDFKYRINRYNFLNGFMEKPERKLEPHEYSIKYPNYKGYCHAYVKALFFNNKDWIRYLEKNHIEQEDKEKFRKLVSFRTYKARQNYFEDRTKKLNPFLKYFIDKNNRFETHNELYNEGKGVRGISETQ